MFWMWRFAETTQMHNDGSVSVLPRTSFFVTLVMKMWVNSFGARSMVVEELVTVSRSGAADRFGFLWRW